MSATLRPLAALIVGALSIGTLAALALLVTTATACGGAPTQDADVPSAEIARTPPGGGGDAVAPATLVVGDGGAVLPYMPASCPSGRVYVHAGALLAGGDSQDLLRQITRAILDRERDDPTAAKAIEAVRRSGFDLATGVVEAAMCLGEMDNDHVLAARLSVDDPLSVLNDIARSLGEADLPIEDSGGARTLVHDDFAFVQPAPGILVMGDVRRAALATERAGATGFKGAAELVAYVDMPVDGGAIVVKLRSRGSQLKLDGSMRLVGPPAQAIAEHPHEVSVEMKKKVLQEARSLRAGPFRVVYKRLQDVEITAAGDTLFASLTFPADDIPVLLTSAAPLLGIQIDRQGNMSGDGDGDTMDELLELIRNTK